MGVIFENGYTLPSGDQPLTHARIAHAGNWLGGTAAASSTDADFFAEGPANSLTYEKWKPNAIPATWALDFGSAQDVDYCVVAAHNLGTAGCAVRVQKWNGTGWANIIAHDDPGAGITDEMEIMYIFEPVSVSKMRIKIESGNAPTIGMVKFGKAMQMPQPLYGGHSPLDLARQTTMRANISETGEFLGRTKLRTVNAASFSWEHLRASWVRTNWRPFQKAIEDEPFAIAWRPETFSEVALCQSDQLPVPVNMGMQDFMSVELSVRARGYD